MAGSVTRCGTDCHVTQNAHPAFQVNALKAARSGRTRLFDERGIAGDLARISPWRLLIT